MSALRTRAVADCVHRQREIAREPRAGEPNLFTRASALSDRHRVVCEEVAQVMFHRHDLAGVREALLALAADALLAVEAIDASTDHVGAVLLHAD